MKRPKKKPRAAEQKRQEKQKQRREQQKKKRDQNQRHKPKQSKPKSGNATVGKESRADGTGSQANLPPDPSHPSSALAERAFVATRDRDAWATIDGFVYQVVITIERWLSLSDNEALELECGEDIDVVVDSIANAPDDDARFRRLEQVKRLSANVTLRSPPIVEFLASAVEHRQNNPGTTLHFRFVSTASAGTERPSPYRPAIHSSDPRVD